MYHKAVEKLAHKRLWKKIFSLALICFSAHCIFLSVTGLILNEFPFSKTVLLVSCFSFLIWAIPFCAFLWQKAKIKNRYLATAKDLDVLNPHLDDGFQLSQSSLSADNQDNTYSSLTKYYSEKFVDVHWPKVKFSRLVLGILFLGVVLWSLPLLFVKDRELYVANTVWPFQQLQKIPTLIIELESVPQTVKKGEDVRFRGLLKNYSRDQNIYAYISHGHKELRYPVEVNNSRFQFSKQANEDFQIFFAGENGKSKSLKIRALEEPRLSQIQLTIVPPDYTGLKADSLPVGMVEPNVYPGSQVSWSLKADRELLDARLLIWSMEKDSLLMEKKLGGGQIFSLNLLAGGKKKKGDFILPLKYSFILRDKSGIESANAQNYVINAKEDTYPELEIVEPTDFLLENVGKIPLGISAKDDFKISSLYLYYKLSSDGYVKDSSRISIYQWLKASSGSYVFKEWDVGFLGIRPENELEIYLLGCDNDNVSGPKCSRSPKKQFKSPSVQEAMALAAKRESETMSLIKSAVERQKNVEEKQKRAEQMENKDNLPAANFEIRQILLENPRRLLNQAENTLQRMRNMELKGSKSQTTNSQKFRSLEKQIQKTKENLPKSDIMQAKSPEKMETVDRIMRDQKKIKKELESIDTQKKSEMEISKNYLEENIDKALEKEESLKEYLKSEENQKQLEEKLKEEMLSEQSEAVQDVMESTEELQKMIEQSLKNPMFSKDLLEKMEKVQELLREALPDSLRKLMEKKMEGQEVNASDLKNSLSKLMENKDAFEQSIERALRALEDMKKLRELDNIRQELLQAKKREEELKNKLDKAKENKSNSQLANMQESINKSVNKSLSSLEEKMSNAKLPPFLKKEMQKKLKEKMDKLKDQLAKERGDKSEASQTAGDVVKELSQMAESMTSMIQGMAGQQGPSVDVKLIERLTNESLKLSELQMLIASDYPVRKGEGWESEENHLYYSAHQIANWIYQELQKLSAEVPFVSSYLLTQSRILSESLKQSSTSKSYLSLSKAKDSNQKVSRELLKLLKLAKSMPPPSGQGQGQGDPQNSQGNNPEGGSDLSTQLKGLSGKQMAVNQATSELLKSLMKSAKGKGQMQSPQSLANNQGQLGEQLESMAEGADEKGGAASKLRKLAEEARYIEGEMRKGRLTPELKERQERFQSRLLEASNALEERGFSNEREGKLSRLKEKNSPQNTKVSRDKWQELLLKEKKRAQKANMESEDKEKVDGFFEIMLTR